MCSVAQSCPALWGPMTVSCQAPLSMEFSKQEYWSGLPLPTPGDLSNPGIEHASLVSPAFKGRFFTTSVTWEAPSLWDCNESFALMKSSLNVFYYFNDIRRNKEEKVWKRPGGKKLSLIGNWVCLMCRSCLGPWHLLKLNAIQFHPPPNKNSMITCLYNTVSIK